MGNFYLKHGIRQRLLAVIDVKVRGKNNQLNVELRRSRSLQE